jgi:hypothetical protein
MKSRLPDIAVAERLAKLKVFVCRRRTKRCRFCREKILKGQLYYTSGSFVGHRNCVASIIQKEEEGHGQHEQTTT